MYDFGKYLFYAGCFLTFMGALILRWPVMMAWFGKLPGDLRLNCGRYTLVLPLTSILLFCFAAAVGGVLFRKFLDGH